MKLNISYTIHIYKHYIILNINNTNTHLKTQDETKH